MKQKKCRICEKKKAEAEFPLYNYSRNTKSPLTECRDCFQDRANKARYLRQFGITYKEYLDKVERANNLCEICHRPETSKRKKKLSLDHCHETNAVRGVLCTRCNFALGALKDLALLRSAISYLIKYSGESRNSAVGELQTGYLSTHIKQPVPHSRGGKK